MHENILKLIFIDYLKNDCGEGEFGLTEANIIILEAISFQKIIN